MVPEVVGFAGVQIVGCGKNFTSVMVRVRVLFHSPVRLGGEEISKPRTLLPVFRVLLASVLHVNLVLHPFLS